jgi:hypothetical protein
MDVSARHELLVITLLPPPPPPPPPRAAAAAAARRAPPVAAAAAAAAAADADAPAREPVPPEIQAQTDAQVAETLAPLPAIEARLRASLRDEARLFEAEAAAREWLSRAAREDTPPGDARRLFLPAALAFEAALPAARRAALRLTVRAATAHDALGVVCRHTGRLPEARREYEAAVALMEALPPPLTGEERNRLGASHFNCAMLCCTIAAGDEGAFLEHMRAATRPGLTTEHWSGMHAGWTDAALLREYNVGQMDEEALWRQRAESNALMGQLHGFTPINPRPWVPLRACDGCGAREAAPGGHKRCGSCGRAVYCSRGCQAAHWKAGHKRECRTQQAS